MTCNGGGQCSLFIVYMSLNGNICCNWSSQCLKNVWTTLMFCFACGEFTAKAQRQSLMSLLKKTYELHFDCKAGPRDKPWVPHICCGTCASKIRKWLHGSWPSMPFQYWWYGTSKNITLETAISVWPMCKASLPKHGIQHPNLNLAARPVPHDGLPTPKALKWLDHW